MHRPHARLLGGTSAPSQPSPEPLRSPQGQLPLGLAPTGDLALVRERVRKDALDKWDALTPRAQIRLHKGRLWFPEAAQSDFAASLRPTPWAVAQFCQRLGIPAGYFRRCPSRLQDLQFNHWIRQQKGQAEPDEEHGDPPAPERTDEEAPPEETSPEAGRFDGPDEELDRPPSSEPWLLRMKGDVLRGVLSSHATPGSTTTCSWTASRPWFPRDLPWTGSRWTTLACTCAWWTHENRRPCLPATSCFPAFTSATVRSVGMP